MGTPRDLCINPLITNGVGEKYECSYYSSLNCLGLEIFTQKIIIIIEGGEKSHKKFSTILKSKRKHLP